MSATKHPSFETNPNFSVAYNFDPELIENLAVVNEANNLGTVTEVFGALPDSPVSSARPTARLPEIDQKTFARQVEELTAAGIGFNYLYNTNERFSSEKTDELSEHVKRLGFIGVDTFTAGNPKIATVIRSAQPKSHITMSITQGISTIESLKKAEDSGVEAVYLDGIFVNRDFPLLRQLAKTATSEIRLYANMSCISGCEVVRAHYGLFAGEQTESAKSRNDAFFAGCSAIKLKSPVEWIQMPWIRPEDIGIYVDEGVKHFKLSDRLAPTDVITRIAEAYTRGISPPDMFEIIERDGAKMKALLPKKQRSKDPLSIDSSKIDSNFIDHFRSGECTSRDTGCPTCQGFADRAVTVNVPQEDLDKITEESLKGVPKRLVNRLI